MEALWYHLAKTKKHVKTATVHGLIDRLIKMAQISKPRSLKDVDCF